MARAMWSGVISFGMVSIPVKLFTATDSHNVGFHQIHAKCETQIKEHRFCPHCKRDVGWDEIVKGFEYQKSKFIVLSEEDFEKLPLPSRHTIELNSFVALDEIDPVYYDTTYYVSADGKHAAKPYKLLCQAMDDQNVVGLASITFRNKERMCAIRPAGNSICLQTLFYGDEIRENTESTSGSGTLAASEKKMATSLIKALSGKFEPSKYKDNYQDALKKLIKAKMKGTELKVSEAPARSNGAADLMELLQQSLQSAKGGKGKTSAGGTGSKRKTAVQSSSRTGVAKKKPTRGGKRAGKAANHAM